MRIRIQKSLSGVIEGKPLSQFIPGEIYDIDDFTGSQLVLLHAAVEVRSTDSTTMSEDTDLDRLTGGIHVVQPDKADERPERRRRNRR